MDDPLSNPANMTDAVVAAFEGKLKQNILTKTLLASKDGLPLKLTDEEITYLTKQAVEESVYSQMEVETPSPIITLKKGKTELQIKNAATILQKMEEKYPSAKPAPKLPLIQPTLVDNLLSKSDDEERMIDEELNEIIDEVEKEFENPGSSERVHITSKPTEEQGTTFMKDHFKKCVNFPVSKVSPEVASAVAPDESKFHPIKTVNRNAYEIREGVLAMALDFVKWQTGINLVMAKESGMILKVGSDAPKSDTVLDVAKKFYAFVEQRR